MRIPGFPYGGKTGTRIYNGRKGRHILSSFVAYAPAASPELVILAMVENPKLAHYGSVVAGPVVKEILKKVFPMPDPNDIDAANVAVETPPWARLHEEGSAAKAAAPAARAAVPRAVATRVEGSGGRSGR